MPAYLGRLTQMAKRTGGIDLLVRYNPLLRPKVKKAIAQTAQSDLQKRRHVSAALLSEVIDAARRTRYGNGRAENYDSWPVLTKETVRDRFGDLCNRGLLDIPAATGGSTGIPVKLIRSFECVAAEQLFLDSLIASEGMTFSTSRIAVLRADKIKPVEDDTPPFGLETHRGKRLLLSAPHLNRKSIGSYIEEIEAFAPDILWAYPTTAMNLLRLSAEAGKTLRIPVVLLSSEQVSASAYHAMESGFGAKIVDYYGLAERVCLAYSIGFEKYLFHPAYGKVELLPADEPYAEPGRRLARIVATGFWNKAMPFIRYETGDYAIVDSDAGPAELEEIALGARPFYGIAGRTNDFIYGPDDTPIAGMNHFPRDVGHLLRIQVIQNEDRSLDIQVLAMPGFDETDRQTLLANIRNKVPEALPVSISVVENLVTTPGGKSPFIIRRYQPAR